MGSFAGLGERVRRVRFMRVVRRVHMYAGLLLLPWILLFGLSGMLFNHPSFGEEVISQPLGREELARAGLRAWEPEQIAERVLRAINDAAGRPAYRRDPEFPSELSGFTVLSAPSAAGQHMVLLDMAESRGVLVSRTARRAPEGSSFPKTHVSLPDVSTREIERELAGLLKDRQIDAMDALRAHPKIAPELRFRVRDAAGTRWNLAYDLGSGTLTGRKSDAFPNLGLTQLLAKLHTTHHFPLRFGALWLWALFADLLGITMVFWALSGIVMWWQLKATRVVGIASLAIALGIAAAIIGGTVQHLTFGDVTPALGPGGG